MLRQKEGANMSGMGTFRTTIRIESHARRGQMTELANVLVDTGSEATWIPRVILESLGVQREKAVRFRVADGREIERQVGFAIIHANGAQTADDVVFAEPGDLVLLGARTLEGLNFKIDPVRHALVDAGPVDAAAA
jgi:predicted aspartyl protease